MVTSFNNKAAKDDVNQIFSIIRLVQILTIIVQHAKVVVEMKQKTLVAIFLIVRVGAISNNG
jgi:hypothetical protein